ncbi:MAG: alanine dehydrogenase [Lentimicrobium sp.]|jgi:alanine dehydrogenase|nr:alanine dehydrogenase [Lentimicrobium sp.]
MQEQNEYYNFSSHSVGLLPQEERLEIPNKSCQLTLGLPREKALLENRVSLVPDAISGLIDAGHRVLVESQAGLASHYSDNQYSEAGAEIIKDTSSVFQCDVIIKVSPPSGEEIDMMRGKQVLLSSLNLSGLNDNHFRKLSSKKITALAYEYLKDKDGNFPVIRAMSEIAGNTSILIAAEYLSHPDYGRGLMFGGLSGISPTEVVILGAGTVGEFAARAAMGMGALVKVFDSSVYRLRRLQNNLGTRIFTSILQPKPIMEALRTADVAIGAVRSQGGLSPVCVTEEMVQQMKGGAIIIDVSIDQGGCFETSEITNHKNPVFERYGVTHYCVPNIASRVPRTAAHALSNLLAPILLKIGEEGGINNILRTDLGVRNGVYLFNGISTNRYISEYFHLPHKDIDLLISAFH